MPFLVHTSMKTMSPYSRAHPQLYCVQIWSQYRLTVPELLTILYTPVAAAVQIHTAMSPSSNPYASPDTPPMAYQAPVPVPLPMYNWAASNQM